MNLILGTVQFGMEYGVSNHAGQPSADMVFQTLDAAWDLGIRVLDSAQAYGQANKIIADYHRSHTKRFSVINKIMRQPESLEHVLASLSRELEMLSIDKFDCILFHHASSISPDLSGLFLENLKKNGITHRVGLSIETPEDYRTLKSRFHFDVIQLPLNILNHNFMPDEFLDELKKDKIQIHARSAFLQGLILGKISSIPAYLQPLASKISAFQKDCAELGIFPATGCLLYLLENSSIDHIVVGAQDITQLDGIIMALKSAQSALQTGVKLPWTNYACDDFELVCASCWPKLKEESIRKIV